MIFRPSSSDSLVKSQASMWIAVQESRKVWPRYLRASSWFEMLCFLFLSVSRKIAMAVGVPESSRFCQIYIAISPIMLAILRL